MLPQIYPTDPERTDRPSIRTFSGRQGRLSETRLKILENLVPKYSVPLPEHKQDLRQVFKSDAVYVDFGCGMGGHTIDLLNQGKSVLAIDVHTAGICDLATYAEQHNLETLRLFHGDGVTFLRHSIADETLTRIDIYFPDPWPKARHNKRRLFTLEFLELVYPLLVKDGMVLLVTDEESYAQQVTEVLAETNLFKQVEFTEEVTMTSFHRRALRLGHKIYPFAMVKN